MNKNPYDSLRLDFLDDSSPIEARASWRITTAKDEVVIVLTAVTPDGRWCYGYQVYWQNGKTSSEKPSASRGVFRSQRDARLHAVGFFLLFDTYFTPATSESLHKAESELAQAGLFDADL